MNSFQSRYEVLKLHFDGKYLHFTIVRYGGVTLFLTSKVKATLQFDFATKLERVEIEHPDDFHMGVKSVCTYGHNRLFHFLREEARKLIVK